MRILSIIGLSGVGKTTLLVTLAREFHRRGKRVATIAHATRPVEVDGDSARHYQEGMADGVLVVSPNLRTVFERRPDDADPETLARAYFADRDLVLVEGFQESTLPKIEIFRSTVGTAPLVASAPEPKHWIALLSDVSFPDLQCPVLRFTDTMWLQFLAGMAWERARVVEP